MTENSFPKNRDGRKGGKVWENSRICSTGEKGGGTPNPKMGKNGLGREVQKVSADEAVFISGKGGARSPESGTRKENG